MAEKKIDGRGSGGGGYVNPIYAGRGLDLNNPDTMPYSRQLYTDKRYNVMDPNIIDGYGGISMYEQSFGNAMREAHDYAMFKAQQKALNAPSDSQEYFDHMVSVPDPIQYKLYRSVIDYNGNGWGARPTSFDTAYPSYVHGVAERAQAEADNERRLQAAYEAYLQANGMY